MLTGAGYDAMTAADPHEAIELARLTDDLDLLLTDVVMPVMTGRALADTIWKTRGPVRVIFMSGYTSDVITRRGELEEGVALLQKPFGSRELLEAVRKSLDAPPAAPPGARGDLSVLIVDDEPVFRDFLKAVIDDIGQVGEVLVAGNGQDALSLYKEHSPSIVFLDSLRDPMPGKVLAERLRSENVAPRIVAVTASGQEAEKPWADSIIHKGARLVDEIARVIDEYR
jgi:CheY-like chemotaxis protein